VLDIPEDIQYPGDLDMPHDRWYTGAVHSRRAHDRAHQRIEVYEPARPVYETRTVMIPIRDRDFSPFRSHWRRHHRHAVLTHHFHPDAKVDRDMNRRQRDYKHGARKDPDSSRADALRLVHPSHPEYGRWMYGALRSDDPGIAADTMLVAWNVLR